MKKIVPFKKELTLDNIAYEIDSISLEHEILAKEEDVISGKFYITGSYKVTEASLIKENFEFTLPFDIALDSRYDVSNMVVDIDDFYYELIDHKILKVNIDLFLDGEVLNDRCIDYLEKENVDMDNKVDVSVNNDNYNVNTNIEDLTKKEVIKEDLPVDNVDASVRDNEGISDIGLFDNIDKEDSFSTYHVYAVRDGDTIDSILVKYGISKEELESYNSTLDIQVGDKLIIPSKKDE